MADQLARQLAQNTAISEPEAWARISKFRMQWKILARLTTIGLKAVETKVPHDIKIRKEPVEKLPRGLGLHRLLQLTTHQLYIRGNTWKCHHCALSMSKQTLHSTLRTFGRYCEPLYEKVNSLNDHTPARITQPKIKVGASYLHDSHNMVYYRGVFLCLRCGGHAVQKPRKLAKVCIERLTTGGQAALKRMSKNKPPAPYSQWPLPENAALPYSMRKGSIELFAELAKKSRRQQQCY